MKILICTFGSLGDVHPYLALGRELLHRGHGVTLATSGSHRETIERHGLGFAHVRPEARIDDLALMRLVMDPRRGTETVVRKIIMPAIRDSYADLAGPASKADLLVSHALSYAVPVLAEKTGQPWVSTVLSPIVFFSAHDVPVLAPLPGLARLRPLGPAINGWIFRQLKKVSRSWSRPVLELRRDLGLPPGEDPLIEGQHSPHRVLAMFSATFGPPQPDWPANVRVTGFPFLDGPETSPDTRLEEFLGAAEPPLVFALGSAAVKVPGAFYDLAIRVARRLDRRAVLVAGDTATRLRTGLPSSMMAVEWADYRRLFARAAAVIHQGGIGTAAQALRAGVPQLVVPFAHDQFDNADRIRRMGCGRVLYKSRITENSLARELGQLLAGTHADPARRMSHEILKENGVAAAADALLDVPLSTSTQPIRLG